MAGATPSATTNSSNSSSELTNTTGPFATITLLFFFWGFITVMNDVLIPFLKESFELSYFQAGLVQFAFFSAFFVVSLVYFLVSLSSGDPINRIGYQRTIVFGLTVCAVGCALFTPAAGAVSYPFFLGALFLVAAGITVLQIAANPYAAILGKPENASARLNLAQGFNSLGTTLAPIIGGILLYHVFVEDGTLTLNAIKSPYLIYAGISLLLAVVIAFSKLPSIDSQGTGEEGGNAFDFPQLRLGMAAIFLYVGAEVAIGSFVVNFLADSNVMGIKESDATIFLAYYWGGAMIGRLCGAIAMSQTGSPLKKTLQMIVTAALLLGLIYFVTAVVYKGGELKMEFAEWKTLIPFVGLIGVCLAAFGVSRGKPPIVLALFSIILIALLIIAALASGQIAMWAVLAAGLFNSIMWSNIFTLAIDDLKEHTSQGSSLLVMMIVGGALFPLLMGLVADNFNIQHAFFVPVISYVYIAFYGFWSHKRITQKNQLAG